MSKIKETSLTEIENKIATLLKEKEEFLRVQKVEDVIELLRVSSYTEIQNVELYLLKKATISASSVVPAKPKPGTKEEKGTKVRFDLKAEHLSDSVLAVLDKETKKSKKEILVALGIVEGMGLNGAASFESYVTKFNTTVFADLVKSGKILTHGSKISMTYTKA